MIKDVTPFPVPIKEYRARIEKCRRLMEERELNALLVFSDWYWNPNARYLLGYTFQPIHGIVIIVIAPTGDPTLIIDRVWGLEGAKERVWIDDVRPFVFTGEYSKNVGFAKLAKQVLTEKGVPEGRIGVAGTWLMPAYLYENIKKEITKAEFVDVTVPVEKLRMVKTPREIELMRKVSRIADAGIIAGMEAIEEGVTEYEVALAQMRAMMEAGADSINWVMVQSGPDSQYPVRFQGNFSFTSRKIRNGDMVHSDICAIYGGYYGDLARTKIVGDKSREKVDLAEACLKIEEALIDTIRPGVKAVEIFKVAKNKAKELGYIRNWPPGFFWGHGTGLIHDEHPWFVPGDHTPLEANMVVNVHSGLAIPGEGGVKIEDIILLTEKGHEVLTKAPRRWW
ncbi:MAG: M24 family metallopeptidase [Candidatus Geothermarchaeales archaeon]